MAIGVVIPYFQEEPGILRKALESVLAQEVDAAIDVVVVEDASPVAADAEIAGLPSDPRVRITVVRQANAGPAAARNRALAALVPRVERIAFLDSDDRWTPAHLARAQRALADDADFYFADFYQLGQDVSAFRRASRLDPGRHPEHPADPLVRRFHGDMLDQIVRGNVIGTPTVVYNVDVLGEVRFDDALFSAGEDYLFWIACAQLGARFCFSVEPEAHCGEGVNIYARARWGSPGHLKRVCNEMRYRKTLLSMELSAAQRAFVRREVARLRRDFAGDLLHRLSHRMPLPLAELRRQARQDPASFLHLPSQAVASLVRRVR